MPGLWVACLRVCWPWMLREVCVWVLIREEMVMRLRLLFEDLRTTTNPSCSLFGSSQVSDVDCEMVRKFRWGGYFAKAKLN